jgi:DNA-binding NtrC family response regulator
MTAPRPRVLVVDDEESMRFFLRRALSRRGFEVETAEDGPEGLRRFADARPDAVLLDVKLPGMNGREVLERIRVQDPDVPVIVMTGYASVEDAMGAMWAGATDYVRKPLRADDVAGALERAVAARARGPSAPSTVRALASRGEATAAARAAGPARVAPPRAPEDPVAWLRAEAEARGLRVEASAEDPDLDGAVRLFERLFVDELLRRAGGNVARAARAAGISRPNFHRKMRALGMDAGPYRRGGRR